MNTRYLAILATLAFLGFSVPALAITAGQIDDFEDGTVQGWTEGGTSPNKPVNVAAGGPQGGNDNYLRDVSSGGAGAGGKMTMFNRAQWTGNYNTAGIVSIRMSLVNEGNTAMQIRIVLGEDATASWFVSTSGFALPADGVWRQATFELNSDNLISVQGMSSLATVLSNVDELRIISSGTPKFRGDAISATLGVDDIEAVAKAPPPPPPPKEFLDLAAMANFNGNNKTDLGVLLRDPGTARTSSMSWTAAAAITSERCHSDRRRSGALPPCLIPPAT